MLSYSLAQEMRKTQLYTVVTIQGMIAAAPEVREWATELIAQYANATHHASVPTPVEILAHITDLQGKLAQADSQLRFGVDLAGQVPQGEATQELHEEAEKSLWDALHTFFLLNLAVDMLGLLRSRRDSTVAAGSGKPRKVYHDTRISPDDLWRVVAPSARSEIRGTEFGTDEMQEMCEKMGGILSAGAQQYLDEVEEAVARGDAALSAAIANCPFEPLYKKARRPPDIAGSHLPAGHEFLWIFQR